MIKLPEDDYHEVACLIQYLYTGDFALGSTDERPEPYKGDQSGQFAARVYVLADKYQIEGLKTVAAHKIIGLCNDQLLVRAFLKAAQVIYDNTASSDQIFRKQFKEAIKEVFIVKGGEQGDLAAAIKEILTGGGEIAFDIFDAQRAALFLPPPISTPLVDRSRVPAPPLAHPRPW